MAIHVRALRAVPGRRASGTRAEVDVRRQWMIDMTYRVHGRGHLVAVLTQHRLREHGRWIQVRLMGTDAACRRRRVAEAVLRWSVDRRAIARRRTRAAVAGVARLIGVDVEIAVDVPRRIGDHEPTTRSHRVVALAAVGIDRMGRRRWQAVTRSALALRAIHDRPHRLGRRTTRRLAAIAERCTVTIDVATRRAVPTRGRTGEVAELDDRRKRVVDMADRQQRCRNHVALVARDRRTPCRGLEVSLMRADAA